MACMELGCSLKYRLFVELPKDKRKLKERGKSGCDATTFVYEGM